MLRLLNNIFDIWDCSQYDCTHSAHVIYSSCPAYIYICTWYFPTFHRSTLVTVHTPILWWWFVANQRIYDTQTNRINQSTITLITLIDSMKRWLPCFFPPTPTPTLTRTLSQWKKTRVRFPRDVFDSFPFFLEYITFCRFWREDASSEEKKIFWLGLSVTRELVRGRKWVLVHPINLSATWKSVRRVTSRRRGGEIDKLISWDHGLVTRKGKG